MGGWGVASGFWFFRMLKLLTWPWNKPHVKYRSHCLVLFSAVSHVLGFSVEAAICAGGRLYKTLDSMQPGPLGPEVIVKEGPRGWEKAGTLQSKKYQLSVICLPCYTGSWMLPISQSHPFLSPFGWSHPGSHPYAISSLLCTTGLPKEQFVFIILQLLSLHLGSRWGKGANVEECLKGSSMGFQVGELFRSFNASILFVNLQVERVLRNIVY